MIQKPGTTSSGAVENSSVVYRYSQSPGSGIYPYIHDGGGMTMPATDAQGTRPHTPDEAGCRPCDRCRLGPRPRPPWCR